MKLRPFAAACGTAFICLSVCPSVLAEESTQLEQVVVTADRKARTVDETLTPVTVITRKDIEKYQATDVAEVLRRVPGISITNNGGMGKVTSVRLRGTAANHLLVLIDGVQIGSATLGSVSFEHLSLDQVERIEVVRGPRSSLYGSEAIGGVVQIFTRKGGKGFQPEIIASIGSHNAQKLNVNLAGGDADTWFNVNAGTEKTDGIDTTSNQQEPDNDGYRRESASLRAGHRFTNGTEVEAALLHTQGDNAFDGSDFSGNSNDFVQESISGKVKHAFGERVKVSAQVGQSLDETYNYFNGGNLNPFASRQLDTRRETASLQADVVTSVSGALTIGVDRQKDKIISDSVYTVTSRENDGVFASYQHDFGKTDVEVSARRDDNQQFDKHSTGAIAIGHEIGDAMRIKASYGTAFKAPTFNALYSPWGGDPNLKPETSQNIELGLSGRGQGFTWDAAVFQNKITDYIEWEEDAVGNWTVSNVQPTIKGLEARVAGKLGEWDVASTLTLQNPKKRSGPFANQQMVNTPKQIFNVDVDRKLGAVSVGATLHAEDARHGNAANTDSRKLPGYTTVDLRADYRLAKDWTVGAKIGNVLDKDYQTNSGYNQDGINGVVTLNYAPK